MLKIVETSVERKLPATLDDLAARGTPDAENPGGGGLRVRGEAPSEEWGGRPRSCGAQRPCSPASPRTTAPAPRRLSSRCARTRTACSASSTSRPSTGCPCGPPTRSNRPLPPSAGASGPPRAPAHGPRPCSWLPSCSTWHSNAGDESPHRTSSLWSEKEYHSTTELR